MNIFITGCAGFIGSHLSERLLRQGHSVSGLDNMNSFYDPDLKKENLNVLQHTSEKSGTGFAFYEGDIRHAETIAHILTADKIDIVIHLAAMAGVRPSFANPLLYADVNIKGTMTILEEMKKADVKRLIFGSSSSVYGNTSPVPFKENDPALTPISPYAATKRAAEIMCDLYARESGLNVAVLRFFTVYGPRQRPDLAIAKFSKLLLEGRKIPIYGDGKQSRDFTYSDDILVGIDGAIEWLKKNDAATCEIFNLGEAATTSLADLIRLLAENLGKPADIQYLPKEAGDVTTTFADIKKSKEILGYNPQVKLADGVKRYADWLKSRNV